MTYEDYSSMIERLQHHLGRLPTASEMADELSVSRQAVETMCDRHGLSLMSARDAARAEREKREQEHFESLDPVDLQVLVMTRRPGARLLHLLEEREITLMDFAVQIGLVEDRRDRNGARYLRRYTHPPVGKPAVVPKMAMVKSWADVLGVEWGYFFQPSDDE